MVLASVDSFTRRTTCKLFSLGILALSLSCETRTRLVHSIKASAAGLDDLQIAEIIRQKGEYHGYTPLQSLFGYPAPISCNTLSSIRWSEPARVELVREGGEDDPSEEVSVYMEAQEAVDLPALGDQSHTQEGTPAESVLVLEENITSWLEAVPDDLTHRTPSPLALPSPPEVANHSGTAAQPPLPIQPSNHWGPLIILPSKQYEELKRLEKIFNRCSWLLNELLEPVIGDPDCPPEAEKYGIRGTSCYTAFVEDHGDTTYGCRHEICHLHPFRFTSLDGAVRHQRYHHFDHRPFMCVPLSGAQWCAIFFSLFKRVPCQFSLSAAYITDCCPIAANDSTPKPIW